MESGCASDHAISRRSILFASASAAAALAVSACDDSGAGSAPALPETALITLGVVAGPVPVAGRIGISSVLKVGDALYLIDCGLGSVNAFCNAGLRFPNLKSLFITHLHTDHIVDYFSFFLTTGMLPPGLPPVRVFGPGPAGGLPPSRVGNPDPPTIAPQQPTPGLAALTDDLRRAFAYTGNIFIRDLGYPDYVAESQITEIAVPPGSDFTDRSPRISPFPVTEDDNVVVTATLVSHYDVYPAFGFRFDLKQAGVSVTFSGDTTKSDNLIELARSTDILVHESAFSLDDAYWHNIFPPGYLTASHTSARQAGEVAAAAGAGQLIISHYQPADLPDATWRNEISQAYSGRITIAEDGQIFAL